MSATTLSPGPVDRVSLIISMLKRAIHGVGGERKLDFAFCALLCTRLNRLLHRFQSLIQNQPRRPHPPIRQNRPPAKPQTQPTPPTSPLKIPTTKNWLLILLPSSHIREPRSHFFDLIQHPDMAALAAQTPQLARQVLRPLCRFLSIPIPLYLQLPARPRKQRPKRIRKPKPPKPPKPPEPTLLEYLLAKYPPTDEPSPGTQLTHFNQIRKIFSR